MENREKAGEYLRLTLKYIAKYKLVTNLVNIIIFYEYVEGKNRELRNSIDEIVNKDGTIKSEQIKQIYEKYFNSGHPLITDKLLNRFNKFFKELTLLFSDSVDDMSNKARKVEELSTQISKVKNYDDIGNMVDKMLVEIKSLVLSHQKAYLKIKSSSDDIDVLKSQLAKVEYEAQTDSLTGLYNRRAFELQLQNERIKAITNSETFSIMMVDIDSFKKINDTHGHLAGDSILKNLADVFLKNLRKSDFAARVGGDEFCIIMSETNLSGASFPAIKIKNIIAGQSLYLKESRQNIQEVTISIGIAQYQFNESEEDLIKRADDALYLAKESGRNTIKTENEL